MTPTGPDKSDLFESHFKVGIDGFNNFIKVQALHHGAGTPSYNYMAHYTSPDGYDGGFSFTIPVGTASCIVTKPLEYESEVSYSIGAGT